MHFNTEQFHSHGLQPCRFILATEGKESAKHNDNDNTLEKITQF